MSSCPICGKSVSFGLICSKCEQCYHRICCGGTASYLTREQCEEQEQKGETLWFCPNCHRVDIVQELPKTVSTVNTS